MSQSAALLAGAQALHAQEFPCTIRIGPQSYDAGGSGLRSQSRLGVGGFAAVRACSFWLPALAFTEAGQPLPQEQTALTCTAPAALAGEYLIESVLSDAAGATVTLRCTAPSQ